MAEDRMLSDEILLGLIKKNSGGGGGGTGDYNDLSNQPQINGNTLIGNKTASDLGLASENDLADKQDVLTAGNYVSITNDGTINVTKAIGVYDNVRYVFTPEGGGYHMRVEVYINDVKRFEQQYQNTAVFNHVVIMDLIEFWYGGDGYYWHYMPLIDSREHAKDEDIRWYYTEMDVHEETFDVPQDDSTTLATKGDIDAAISSAYHHAGTKTCVELVAGLLVAENEGNVYNMTDSGTTTADFIEGAGQPIKAGDNVGIAKISDGVYKFDLLSGFVDTTNFVQKSVTAGLLKNDGTVNDEIEGDVATLKCGLTNYQAQNNQNLEVPNRKNLIDSSAYSNGYFTSEGVLTGNQYYYATDYIKVEPNTDYVVSGFTGGGAYFVYYNASKTVLSTVVDTTTTFKTPANTAFVRLSIKRDGMTNPQMELGTTATAYTPYIPSVDARLDAVESGLTNVDIALSVPDGTGKNLIPMTVDAIKATNTNGTWSGNVYSYNGINFTIQTDANNNITGINANGTASNRCVLTLTRSLALTKDTILSGCPSNGGNDFFIVAESSVSPYTRYAKDEGNGYNISSESIVNPCVVYIEIVSGVSISNKVFYPMIRPAVITDATFAPYIPSVESRLAALEAAVAQLTNS